MKSRVAVLLCVSFLGSAPNALSAQSIHILFMQSVLPQTLAYKKELKVDAMDAFMAAGLLGISGERANGYLKKIASSDAVLIVGEDSLKAAGQIPFPMPVIIVNGTGPTAATGPVFRVLEADFAGSVPGAKAVASAGDVSVGALTGSSQTAFKCQGVGAAVVIGALLAAIKNK